MKVAIKKNAFSPLTMSAKVIGYNPYTKRFLVCDEQGYLINYISIHRVTGKELSKNDYKQLENEIKQTVCGELSKKIPKLFRM